MDADQLNLQMADLVWCMSTGLRAGYSLYQVFGVIAEEAPEPAATACKCIKTDLESGLDIETALNKWSAGIPSQHLERLVATMLDQRKSGGNLADLLDPLSESFFAVSGSDTAFYKLMRQQAKALHAQVPPRVR